MDIDIVAPIDLTQTQKNVWGSIQESHPFLNDPFLSWEFASAVARVKKNIEIAVMSRSGQPCGFLAFERERNQGRPIASLVNELQAVVVRTSENWHANDLLQPTNLKQWTFDCGPAFQKPLAYSRFCIDEFPYADMSLGFDEYKLFHRRRGSNFIAQLERKKRKLEREVGKLSYEFQCTDFEKPLNQLFQWKSDQYRQSGKLDVLKLEWVRNLIRETLQIKGASMAGILSTLRVGDELVATHLGLKNDKTLNCWFPAYSPASKFQKYSPGMLLMLCILKDLPNLGIDRFHFGRGNERYKMNLKNGHYEIVEGSLTPHALRWKMNQAYFQIRNAISSTGLLSPVLTMFRQQKQRLLRLKESRSASKLV
ncbi:MAG: GNAT family N-acetyltransferase [Planctomycetota bacterium]